MSSEDKSNAETAKIKAISQRKLEANRDNAQKSTGPRTSQGKANSRFNAERHGLTARRLMFAADGKPNGLHELAAALRDKFGRGDVVTELLIDNLLADYWRQDKGLEAEASHISNCEFPHPEKSFHAALSMALILRYNATNRRAFIKSLELLAKFSPQPAKVPADRDDSSEIVSPPSTGRKTEVGPQEQPLTTLVVPDSQMLPTEPEVAPEPSPTAQVLTFPEATSDPENEKASPGCDDPAAAGPAAPVDTEVGPEEARLDDEEQLEEGQIA
jgi:hypothetical protein